MITDILGATIINSLQIFHKIYIIDKLVNYFVFQSPQKFQTNKK